MRIWYQWETIWTVSRVQVVSLGHWHGEETRNGSFDVDIWSNIWSIYIYNYIYILYRMKDWLHLCLTINWWWSNEHIYDVVKCHYITIRLLLLALSSSSSFITITFYNCQSGWWPLWQQGCWLWWSPDFWQALTGVCWIFEALPLPISWIFLVFQSQNQFQGTSKLENHHF